MVYHSVATEYEVLDRFRDLVERHQGDPGFSMASVPAHIALSRMHVNRVLRALTGLSTHQYIQGIRLDAACKMIDRTPLPIAVIAHRVGFRSIPHFTKVFRVRFACTPASYRRLILSHPST